MSHFPCNEEPKLDGYIIQRELGKGSFATVYQAIKNDHEDSGKSRVAIKAISLKNKKLSKKILHSLEMEIEILGRLRHSNIVTLGEVYKTETNFFLVLEYCAGGDLQRLICTRKASRLSERLSRRLMRDLSLGLHFLHEKKLIHRDIKPQNLLLTGPLPLDEKEDPSMFAKDEETRRQIDFPSSSFQLKIADFGFARYLPKASMADTLCGSPLYMAPEVLQQRKYDGKADLWSAGCALFEMITGSPPFNGENQIDLLRNIQQKAVRLPENISVSKECVKLLRILLSRNPAKRASFDEFYEAVNEFATLGCNGHINKVTEQVYNPPLKVGHVSIQNRNAVEKVNASTYKEQFEYKDLKSTQDNTCAKTDDGSCHHKTNTPTNSNSSFGTSSSDTSTYMKKGITSPVCLVEQMNQHIEASYSTSRGREHGSFVLVGSRKDQFGRSSQEKFLTDKKQPARPPLSETRTSNFRNGFPAFLSKAHPSKREESKSRRIVPLVPELNNDDGVKKNKLFIHRRSSSEGNHESILEANKCAVNLQALTKILEVSEDVGRRAVAVARLGDMRINFAVRIREVECSKNSSGIHYLTNSESDSSLSRNKEVINQVCGFNKISHHLINTSAQNNVHEESLNPDFNDICDTDYLQDEMPFAMTNAKAGSRQTTGNIPCISSLKQNRTDYDDSIIADAFFEGQLCYMKSMNFLKSSINGCISVINQLDTFVDTCRHQSADELKSHSQMSHSWLVEQYLSVLERADSTNNEIRKYSNTSNPSNSSKTRKYVAVEELIYNQILILGRDGAVKKVLGQYNIARDRFRLAGLLVETLLMEPKLEADDRKVLVTYVQEFAQCIAAIDELNAEESTSQ